MTYLESAKGQIITLARAIQELKSHGVTDTKEFYQEMGKRKMYNAYKVLEFLGY